MDTEIWYYRSCGKEIFAIVSRKVPKTIINTIDNRYLMGKIDTDRNLNMTFRSKDDMIEFLEENELDYTLAKKQLATYS